MLTSHPDTLTAPMSAGPGEIYTASHRPKIHRVGALSHYRQPIRAPFYPGIPCMPDQSLDAAHAVGNSVRGLTCLEFGTNQWQTLRISSCRTARERSRSTNLHRDWHYEKLRGPHTGLSFDRYRQDLPGSS